MANPTPLHRDVARLTTDEEILALRAENERLRELVGPSEKSYVDLKLDVLGARDAARAAEASLGELRGRCNELQAERDRFEREFQWFRHLITSRVMGLRRYLPTLRNLARRLSSR